MPHEGLPRVSPGAAADSCAPPDPHPRAPRELAPPNACDCHVHLFGPVQRYPFVADAAYLAPDALPEALFACHDVLGVSRAVVVHPAVLGVGARANVRTFDALAEYPDRLRGIAVLAPRDKAGDIVKLEEAGFRGARFVIRGAADRTLGDSSSLFAAMARLGWHAQILLRASLLPRFAGELARLPVPVVLDHLAGFPDGLGVDSTAFAALRKLLATGKVWVKLSGPMRFSKAVTAPFVDALPILRELVDTAPDRLLWGSDWPHTNLDPAAMPNDGELFDLLFDWVPNERARHRILVDNPALLYRF